MTDEEGQNTKLRKRRAHEGGHGFDPAPVAWCFAGMKKLLTIVLCAAVAVLAGCTKPREVDMGQLQERNGIAYLPNEEKPFTGVAVMKYDNGQKKRETTWKDGKTHGLMTKWYENEQN